MEALTAIATVNGLVGALMPLPQIIKIVNRGHAEDVSLTTWWVSLITSMVWTYYGFQIEAFPLICSGILMSVLDVALIGYVMWFINE